MRSYRPVTKLLESHAPVKEKYVRCNQAPFMNKDIRKAVLMSTRLLNKFRKVGLTKIAMFTKNSKIFDESPQNSKEKFKQ